MEKEIQSADPMLMKSYSDTFKMIRKRLGQSQAKLADILCISKKAVQSYEQGWREIPVRIMREMLVLLSLKNRKRGRTSACWTQMKCLPQVRDKCPSYTISDGRMCWFIASRTCRSLRTGSGNGNFPCLECPVVQGLFAEPMQN